MRITLQTLRQQSGDVVGAEVHSIEGQSYMVIIRLSGGRRILCDDRERTMRFPSLPAANELLEGYGVSNRELVHESAYNEMIGLDEVGIDALRIPTGRTH